MFTQPEKQKPTDEILKQDNVVLHYFYIIHDE